MKALQIFQRNITRETMPYLSLQAKYHCSSSTVQQMHSSCKVAYDSEKNV